MNTELLTALAGLKREVSRAQDAVQVSDDIDERLYEAMADVERKAETYDLDRRARTR